MINEALREGSHATYTGSLYSTKAYVIYNQNHLSLVSEMKCITNTKRSIAFKTSVRYSCDISMHMVNWNTTLTVSWLDLSLLQWLIMGYMIVTGMLAHYVLDITVAIWRTCDCTMYTSLCSYLDPFIPKPCSKSCYFCNPCNIFKGHLYEHHWEWIKGVPFQFASYLAVHCSRHNKFNEAGGMEQIITG